MGIFTWTDARFENPKCNQYGSYKKSQVIGYGGYAKVVCPDETEIEEFCYQGYGMFGGHDIYNLIVDWNKEHLREIFSKMSADNFGVELRPVAIAFQEDGEEAAKIAAKRILPAYPLANEWKRTIGIAIGCFSNKEDILCPYPIKVTTSKKKCSYEELFPSLSTQ